MVQHLNLSQIKECISTIRKEDGFFYNNQYIFNKLLEYNVPLITKDNNYVKIKDHAKIRDYFCQGYFFFIDKSKHKCLAIDNLTVLDTLQINDDMPIVLVSKEDLYLLLEKCFSSQNTLAAKYYIETISPHLASRRVNYLKMIIGFFVIFISTFYLFINVFNIINGAIYLIQSIFKFILLKATFSTNNHPCGIQEYSDNLPIYTILVPLYKEIRKLKSILTAIGRLNYPKDKIDVKFIVEADDNVTIKALMTFKLPSYIHIIKVPYSFPRTKPKAMNYAMHYVRGEYLTIYDAEDRPDPDQLLKALYSFGLLSDEYVCLQARLNYYNAEENILTRCFSMEYQIWFEYLMKGLCILNMPILLGGTSNHFKTKALFEIGFWDAYNVTEDAELGIRLYLNGYKVQMLGSETLEEAPIYISNWLYQRSRWIKGFIQTFYITLMYPKNISKINWRNTLVIYILLGFALYGFLCLPWLLALLFVELSPNIYALWLLNSFFAFAYLYGVNFFLLLKKYKQFRQIPLIEYLSVILWPFYFILHSIACYMAIKELIFSPFKWNKTKHGISSQIPK